MSVVVGSTVTDTVGSLDGEVQPAVMATTTAKRPFSMLFIGCLYCSPVRPAP